MVRLHWNENKDPRKKNWCWARVKLKSSKCNPPWSPIEFKPSFSTQQHASLWLGIVSGPALEKQKTKLWSSLPTSPFQIAVFAAGSWSMRLRSLVPLQPLLRRLDDKNLNSYRRLAPPWPCLSYSWRTISSANLFSITTLLTSSSHTKKNGTNELLFNTSQERKEGLSACVQEKMFE